MTEEVKALAGAPREHAPARAILAASGITLPEAEIARFAESAAVIRALAEAVPPAPSFADEPAVIFDPARAARQ